MILGQDCNHSSLGVMTGKNFKQFELLTIILPLCLFNFYTLNHHIFNITCHNTSLSSLLTGRIHLMRNPRR